MDARVYFTLQDAIDTAESAVDLTFTRELIAATTMHQVERRALEGRLRNREVELRAGDVTVQRAPARRAD